MSDELQRSVRNGRSSERNYFIKAVGSGSRVHDLVSGASVKRIKYDGSRR